MRRARYALEALAMAAPLAAAAVIRAKRAGAGLEDLYDLPMPHEEPRVYGAGYGAAPIYYHHSEMFSAMHAASFEAVRDALPSHQLHPVRLPDGRAVILVAGLQHADITASGVDGFAALPYGEVLVGALVTRRAAPRGLPLVAPPPLGLTVGAFVLHLPVTSLVARDVGHLVWGYPKFIADMEFGDSVRERRVHLSERGRAILTLSVRPSGRPSTTHRPLILYSVLGTDLVELVVPTHGIEEARRLGGVGILELGDHPVADGLRALAIAPRPFATSRTTRLRLVMRRGRVIGQAERYVGYVGEERDLGRYVVRYPNAGPIDQYAPYAVTAGPDRARERDAGRPAELVSA